MRPLPVVILDEVIELGLLLEQVFGGRLSSLFFECQMHALVPTVLLRVTRFDALDVDPEPQPPHGELTQAEEGGAAGEGNAIVGADRQRQPKVFKNPFKHAKCVHLLGCVHIPFDRGHGFQRIVNADSSGT